MPALVVVALLLVGFLYGVILLKAGAITCFVHCGDQVCGVDLLEHFDVRAFVGEVDRGVLHARDSAQGALDTTRATGAGHAGNWQVERIGTGHSGHSLKAIASKDQPCHVGKVKSRFS